MKNQDILGFSFFLFRKPDIIEFMMRISGFLLDLFIIQALFFLPAMDYAQTGKDSTFLLPGISVEAPAAEQSVCGLTHQRLDSGYIKAWTLGELLNESTTIYVKSLGPGNLASISFRGCNAQQAAILWHGVDLKAPGAGMIDLNLVPGAIFDDVDVIRGGNSAVNGSGSIGGSIILNSGNRFDNQKKLIACLNFGSFNENNQNVSFHVGKEKWFSSSALFSKSAKNDFSYYYNSEKKVVEHASIIQYGFIQEAGWKPSKKQQLTMALWYQNTFRELPPSLTSVNMNAERSDQSLRIIPEWKIFNQYGYLKFKFAWFYDDLHYFEKPNSFVTIVDSRIKNESRMLEVSMHRGINTRFKLDAGLQAQNSHIFINEFGGNATQSECSAWLSLNGKSLDKKLKTSLNIRLQLVDGYKAFPAPSIGFERKLSLNFLWRAHLSIDYRIPSMNDRFWKPGGNEDLQPEKSYNAESGISWKSRFGDDFSLIAGAGFFMNKVDNWIAWNPGPSYWSAENLRKVEMSGVEADIDVEYKFYRFTVKANSHYSYVNSRYKNKVSALDDSYNKQLMYTPYHRYTGLMSISFKNITLKYSHVFTGLTWMSNDNTGYLPPWWTGNFSLDGVFSIQSLPKIHLCFDVRNAWNANYQVVQYYPMPGRACYIAVKFDII